MIRFLFLPLFVLAVSSGCSGNPEPVVPVDPALERHVKAGQSALALDRPDQAVDQFSQGLERARIRDDPVAISDLSFDLAVAQLQSNQPEATLVTVRATQAELVRRGAVPITALKLAEAIALYRTGSLKEADAVAAEVEVNNATETGARASFLRGLIADDEGDAAALERALRSIPVNFGPEQQADAAELSARLALRQGDNDRARVEAERDVSLRRDLGDYHSLARGLGLAASAAERIGDFAAAADLYLRAGRNAAAHNDKKSAMRWLGQSIALSRDPAVSEAARSALAGMAVPR